MPSVIRADTTSRYDTAAANRLYRSPETLGWRAEEQDSLRPYGTNVQRFDSALIITPTNGSAVIFRDVPTDMWATHRSYHFITYLSQAGSYLVARDFYEGGDYLLVSETTGDTLAVDAPPVFSPTAKRFLTASDYLASGMGNTAIRVYGIEGRRPSVQWELSTDGESWAPTDAHWLSETEIALTKRYDDGRQPEATHLTFDGNEWHLSR